MRCTVFSVVCLALTLHRVLPAQTADISGAWVLYLVQFGEEFDPARVQLKTVDGQVTGTLNELKLTGTYRGESLQLTAVRPDGGEFGQMQTNLVRGEFRGILKRGAVETGLVMRRLGGQQESPQVRTFVPEKYSRVFSGAVAPALHINPGDTVKTTTVDAGGRDENGVSRSLGGNPQTGPFYIEGALPGDTLAVRINRIHLTRDSAAGGTGIASAALTADYYREAKPDSSFNATWKLDFTQQTASLSAPTARLKNFRVDLKPMIGCVAVAPGNQASFRTGWLGPWGGNMDYRGVQEGTTVYLPVAQEGALLYLGDVHAQQGDGELNGDALETSAAIEFTVSVIPGFTTYGPRAENDEYLMSMGIAGSLDAALKQATTQLARWIEWEYKLTPDEAAIVLGTSIHYEIAEVVDPQVNIVAKIARSALAQIVR